MFGEGDALKKSTNARQQRSILGDETGSITSLSAILLTVLIGFGALSVDVANAYNVRARLQSAADAAALGAAQTLPDTSAATTKALSLASLNVPSSYGSVVASTDVTFGSYDASTKSFTAGGSNDAVQVIASRTSAKGNAVTAFLGAAMGWTSTDVVATSIAYRATSLPSSCVYVLNPANAVNALSVGGGGKFRVPNCGVWVNSSHSKAASSSGASSAVAKAFCIVGNYSGTFTATPTTSCPAITDPLASVTEPTTGTCYSGALTTPTPGTTYCGSITISSDKAFPAGNYYFKGATLTINGGNITGTGVMWYFDATSRLDLGSNGTVTLTPPTSGSYKGISVFQSRSAPTNNSMKITGGADLSLAGTLYMPKASLSLTGNSSVTVTGKTGYVIAYELHYTGTSDFEVGTVGGTQALGSMVPPILVQ